MSISMTRFCYPTASNAPPPSIETLLRKRQMKFTGLILICASSCLALILPAFGIVQFPKVNQSMPIFMGAARPVSSGTNNLAGVPQTPFTQLQSSSSNFRQTNPNSNSDVLPGGFPASTNSAASPFPPSTSTPSLTAITPDTTPSNGAASKFGMGVWLLLGPVCLIGLGLWSFSPNPSGSRPKT